jgi:hypothetical protein
MSRPCEIPAAPGWDASAHDSATGRALEAPSADAVASARAELDEIACAYDRALRRGLAERSRQTTDHAFDETDRLGRRMLAASRRLRSLERANGDTLRPVTESAEIR